MEKTDAFIEKNQGKGLGKWLKRGWGKLKKKGQTVSTNINRKRQVKQEEKINELEAQKAKANAKKNEVKTETKNKAGKPKPKTEEQKEITKQGLSDNVRANAIISSANTFAS